MCEELYVIHYPNGKTQHITSSSIGIAYRDMTTEYEVVEGVYITKATNKDRIAIMANNLLNHIERHDDSITKDYTKERLTDIIKLAKGIED